MIEYANKEDTVEVLKKLLNIPEKPAVENPEAILMGKLGSISGKNFPVYEDASAALEKALERVNNRASHKEELPYLAHAV